MESLQGPQVHGEELPVPASPLQNAQGQVRAKMPRWGQFLHKRPILGCGLSLPLGEVLTVFPRRRNARPRIRNPRPEASARLRAPPSRTPDGRSRCRCACLQTPPRPRSRHPMQSHVAHCPAVTIWGEGREQNGSGRRIQTEDTPFRGAGGGLCPSCPRPRGASTDPGLIGYGMGAHQGRTPKPGSVFTAPRVPGPHTCSWAWVLALPWPGAAPRVVSRWCRQRTVLSVVHGGHSWIHAVALSLPLQKILPAGPVGWTE